MGLSYETIFSKMMAVDDGSYYFKLSEYVPIGFPPNGSFSFTRLDPPDILQEEKKILLSMINFLKDSKDVRS